MTKLLEGRATLVTGGGQGVGQGVARALAEAGAGVMITQRKVAEGEAEAAYLRDTFDVLYREGETTPKMMSVGLHARVVGRPGRAAALARFLEYVGKRDKVWVCRREEIAKHWIERHPHEHG